MIKRDFSKKIEEFRNKSNQEKLTFLSGFWEFDIQNEPFKLIGTYEKADKPDKNEKEYGLFINVRCLNGDILYYPFGLGRVSIWVAHQEYLSKKEFWLLDVKLSNKNDRNPFQLSLVNRPFENPKNNFLDRIDKEKFIRDIFKNTGATQRDAENSSDALKNIAGDLYTETERFIFELLQNADDVPNESGEVDVKFNLLQENLLFLHNGKPFDNNDVDSISRVGRSTKRKDAEKTGYKGIGFKSVFTDAETVLINSGNFSFSFDKHSPLYEALYEGQNIEDIPWQIKPIWTEVYRYPKEVRNNKDFFNYPVAIDLEVGEPKIISYRQQISQLFSEPRFILFLRHIKSIEVQGLHNNIKIQKQKKNKRFELLNNDKPVDEWCIDDFDFSVSQEVRDAMENDKMIPPKLKEIQKSKLSFACQIKDNEIISIPPDKSFLFTYLPTNVNDYSFPFLVNADFLTIANRQDIHKKNSWNLFLFEQIGYFCFEWISKLAQTNELKNSITNLIPKYYENSKEPVHLHFNKGFDKGISEIAFLPTYKPKLTKVSDAIIDLTGYSDVIGEKLFFGTQFADKNLVINELQNKEALSELEEITVFGKDELKKIIANSSFGELTDIKELLEIFNRNKELDIDSCDIRDIIENVNIDCINKWIENCDTEPYEAFLKELEDCYLRKETKERICEIELFKFSDDLFYSVNETRQVRTVRKAYQKQVYNSYSRTYQQQTQYSDEAVVVYKDIIFNSEKTIDISIELQKLGFKTSLKCISEYQNIFSAFLDKLPSDKQLYTNITEKCKTNSLSPQEKKNLFINFTNDETKFAKEHIKELCLFCNNNGEIKPLNELLNSTLNIPNWLRSHAINSDEYFTELKMFLIAEEEIYQKIILENWNEIISEISNVPEFYQKVKFYYDQNEDNTPLKKQAFVYIDENDRFVPQSEVFFNSKMFDFENQYIDFQSAIKSLLNIVTPNKQILKFLNSEPFNVDRTDIFEDWSINDDTELSFKEIKTILAFCKNNNEQFFENAVIEKQGSSFFVSRKSKNVYQVRPSSKEIREFLEQNLADNFKILPYELDEDCKNEQGYLPGIIQKEELYDKILDNIDIDDFKEELIDILTNYNEAKRKFLLGLSEIRFVEKETYSEESFEYKVLERACQYIKESDFEDFRNKIIIESNGDDLLLSNIQTFDKIKVEETELRLSEILPETYQNSNVLSKIIDNFVNLKLDKDKLKSLLGVNEEPEPDKIYELLLNGYSTLQNAQQLAFLLLCDKLFDVNFEKFKVETLDEKSWELKYNYYSKPFSFIGDDYLLKNQYENINELISLPFKIGNSDNIITENPYFTDNEFICPCIKSDLSDEEKTELIDFVHNQWDKNNKKSVIKNIDWSKIGGEETSKILGFNPKYSVYPNEYACESERLPDYLIEWIGTDENKINFLFDLGIWTEKSPIVDLRKFWKNGENFNSNLERETRFDNDETMLFSSLEWLKENDYQLSTNEQYDIFKKVVEIINANRDRKGDLIIQTEFDFNNLEKISTIWNDSGNFIVFLYSGKMPITIGLDEITDYIFYQTNKDDFAVKGKSIYINSKVDIRKILQKVASDDSNGFSFEDLWALFSENTDETDKLKQEIIQLKSQLQLKPDANIGLGGFSNDLAGDDQEEYNREAREVVKEELAKQGFDFSQSYENYSQINGVTKDGVKYPLVVKSTKGKALFLNPNEWLQLCKDNSLLLGVGQNREIRSFTLKSLLGIGEEFNLRFKIDNLKSSNYKDFVKIFHFFSGVHFQFPIEMSIGRADYFASFFEGGNPDAVELTPDNDDLL